MLRFRNPGTQYFTQIQVIKQLYEKLGGQASFSLEDMAVVIAQNKLMTAYGYAGDDALRLSNTDQDSMNSALMNAKMYAEVFRMLGWITPYDGNKSYPLVFTYIGIHVAESKLDCSALYEQCVLGVNNPTELSGRMSYDERVRFFTCALRTFIDLGGTMYKHELCFGPMSINDQDESAYQNMLIKIKQVRGNYNRLNAYFEKFADKLGMKPTPVDNCTRLPIAFMKSCNFVHSVIDNNLYGKPLQCLKITKHGQDVYNITKNMKDMRLDEFNSYNESKKKALIRLGIYSMLKRSGYDLTSTKKIMKNDALECFKILEGRELLFSPYQTIRRGLIEDALDIRLGIGTLSHYNTSIFRGRISNNNELTQTLDLNIINNINTNLLTEPEDEEFINKVNRLHENGDSNLKIVQTLFDQYKTATQAVFYPLIATLFKIIGFNCSFSRPGDNGARWDAIINDEYRSIPIEIKSPTEEQHLSIKAIRQALENKIVLLSRKTHITSADVTTLAVGYYLPNERADVSRLISDIKVTYGYKVGVIDLKSLLTAAVSVLLSGKGFDKENLYYLEGLTNANF